MSAKKILRGFAVPAALMLVAGRAMADYKLNMTRGVTPLSNDVYDLHMLILWICIAIGIVVFGVMFYSIFKHRKSRGHAAAQFHESTALEIAWTVIPFIILIGMAIPATKTLIAMENTGHSDMTVQVTGYQWKWRYKYDNGISFFSTLDPTSNAARQLASGVDPASVDHYLLNVDHPLVVPTGKKIRFLITSNDVIHSWWVPAIGMKKDAIPGYENAIWARIEKPGVYRGQCAELCGRDHGFMPIVVKAVAPKDYAAWVKTQKVAAAGDSAAAGKTFSKDELLARGKDVYTTHCSACHQANGQGLGSTFPALAGSKTATGPVAEHIKTVLHGRPGTAMQAFGPQLSDVELAAVITYERNSWGNNTGDVVQPSDIKAAR